MQKPGGKIKTPPIEPVAVPSKEPSRLGVKAKYAQKLITKCLRRAERLYSQKGRTR